ncbi:MAG: polyprenyl synthetase family protein [Chloroflexota bacterium]
MADMGPVLADSYVPAVAARVRAATVQASDLPAAQELLARLMARPGRTLAPGGAPKWPAMVLNVCHALGGDLVAAVDAAAAVELVAGTAEVVDDLVDNDWREAAEGSVSPQRALNATLALSFLAQRCAGLTARHLGAERAGLIGSLIAEGLLAACAGEDLDLRLEATTEVSEDLAYEMTRRKSGSLVAMACRVGAAVVTDDPAILQRAGEFGLHVGMVAQLMNDIAGVDPDVANRGTDLKQKKKTLPIAYALRCAREEGLADVLAWYESAAALTDEDAQRLAVRLRDLGALQYAWVMADAHRQQALATLQAWARAVGRSAVLDLRRMVPKVDPRPGSQEAA